MCVGRVFEKKGAVGWPYTYYYIECSRFAVQGTIYEKRENVFLLIYGILHLL